MKVICLWHYVYIYTSMCTTPLINQVVRQFCLVYSTTCISYYMNALNIHLLFSCHGLTIFNNDKSYKKLSCHSNVP